MSSTAHLPGEPTGQQQYYRLVSISLLDPMSLGAEHPSPGNPRGLKKKKTKI